jgi:hypothetical protein
MNSLYYNEDCTDFFYNHDTAGGRARSTLDSYIDLIAGAGVTTFLCNTNAQLVNYQSDVWEPFWNGFDPDGPDDQPFLAQLHAQRGAVPTASWRRMVTSMLALHQQGIDYPAHVIQRCRHHNISPWISLRMNDVHDNDSPWHPIHSNFWRDNTQLYRKGYTGYYAHAFDFAHAQVRDYYWQLIEETLERYDIDGLELDFLREPYLFSKGEETKGRQILTSWMQEIRQRVETQAQQRGHAIQLGIRTPSHPDVAISMGIDTVEWARRQLVDLVVVTPRWSTLEYDMPIPEWRQRLDSCDVILAGGLEILIGRHPSASKRPITEEEAFGAAAQVLHDGADSVYLFNYFPSGWTGDRYQQTLQTLASPAELEKQARRHAVTFCDIVGPEGDQRYPAPLPATGRELTFHLPTGPTSIGWQAELEIGLEGATAMAQAAPLASINDSAELTATRDSEDADSRCLTYRFPADILNEKQGNQIRVIASDDEPLEVVSVDIRIFLC